MRARERFLPSDAVLCFVALRAHVHARTPTRAPRAREKMCKRAREAACARLHLYRALLAMLCSRASMNWAVGVPEIGSP